MSDWYIGEKRDIFRSFGFVERAIEHLVQTQNALCQYKCAVSDFTRSIPTGIIKKIAAAYHLWNNSGQFQITLAHFIARLQFGNQQLRAVFSVEFENFVFEFFQI